MLHRRDLVLALLVPILSVALVLLDSVTGWSHGSRSFSRTATALMLAVVLAVPAFVIWICDRLWLRRSNGFPNWLLMPLIGGPVTIATTVTASALAGHLHYSAPWVLASLALGAIYGLAAGLVVRRPLRS
ncbi:MAG: hypothetical protein KL863_09630 [Rhizobium sp.]|nr:hypothetical protein [Rhizobium sp.]